MINKKTPPPEGLEASIAEYNNRTVRFEWGDSLTTVTLPKPEHAAFVVAALRAALATPGTPTEMQEAGRVIIDLCTALEASADVEGKAPESVKLAWRNGCRWMASAPPEASGETQTAAAPAPTPPAFEALVAHLEGAITGGRVTEIELSSALMDLIAEARRCLVLPAALPVSPRPDLEERLARIIAPWFNLEGTWKRFLGNAREIIEAMPSLGAPTVTSAGVCVSDGGGDYDAEHGAPQGDDPQALEREVFDLVKIQALLWAGLAPQDKRSAEQFAADVTHHVMRLIGKETK
jgi:hypothetical protein